LFEIHRGNNRGWPDGPETHPPPTRRKRGRKKESRLSLSARRVRIGADGRAPPFAREKGGAGEFERLAKLETWKVASYKDPRRDTFLRRGSTIRPAGGAAAHKKTQKKKKASHLHRLGGEEGGFDHGKGGRKSTIRVLRKKNSMRSLTMKKKGRKGCRFSRRKKGKNADPGREI